jgi:adenine phosphoribosyltransferase
MGAVGSNPQTSKTARSGRSANVLAACFVIDLSDLGGAKKIEKLGVPVRTLIAFEGH